MIPYCIKKAPKRKRRSFFNTMKEAFVRKRVLPVEEDIKGGEATILESFSHRLDASSTIPDKSSVQLMQNKEIIGEELLSNKNERVETSPSEKGSPRKKNEESQTKASGFEMMISSIPEIIVEKKKSFLGFWDKSEGVVEKRQKFEILLKDFKYENFFQRYFLAIDLLRQLLLVTVVINLSDFPFFVSCFFTSINFLFFLILILKRPYKLLKDFIQNFVSELCLLLSSIVATTLALMDKIGNEDLRFRINIGWVIVATNLLLILLFMLRFVYDLHFMIKKFIRRVRTFYSHMHKKHINKFKESQKTKNEIKNRITSFGRSLALEKYKI